MQDNPNYSRAFVGSFKMSICSCVKLHVVQSPFLVVEIYFFTYRIGLGVSNYLRDMYLLIPANGWEGVPSTTFNML